MKQSSPRRYILSLVYPIKGKRITAIATTSYLYHALGLVGSQHGKTEYHGGAVYYHVIRKRDERTCAGCGAQWDQLTMRGEFGCCFVALPAGRTSQFVILHGYFQQCRQSGKTLREAIDLAKDKRRWLTAFERYVVDLCSIAPIKHVALLGWDVVKEIFKEHLSNKLRSQRLESG